MVVVVEKEVEVRYQEISSRMEHLEMENEQLRFPVKEMDQCKGNMIISGFASFAQNFKCGLNSEPRPSRETMTSSPQTALEPCFNRKCKRRLSPHNGYYFEKEQDAEPDGHSNSDGI